MNPLIQIALLLLNVVGGFYITILLLRLLLPLAKADFYNPISQFVVKATGPVLLPLKKVLPTLGRFDTNILLVTVLIQAALLWAITALQGSHYPTLTILISSLVLLANSLLNIYFYGIIIIIIVSWVAPQSNHPALMLVYQIIEPVMAPLRRILPAMGGLDLSPMLAMVAIYILRILLSSIYI
jgi:YggT family protein